MKIFPSAFLLSFLLLNTPLLTKAQVDVNDSLALVDLYNSTDGPNWDIMFPWQLKYPVHNWYGVTVTNNRVTGLNTTNFRLNGKLPTSIGNLTELTDLYIINCPRLRGKIPHEIGNLTKLTHLELNNTKLNGFLPHEFGNLINLTSLHIISCDIKGKIPNTFRYLTQLQELYISNTMISGQIPKFFKKYILLSDLRLDHNLLTGNIPHELGTINSLRFLFLDHNQLSGTIPNLLGKLKKLRRLHLESNQLTGTIPESIGKLKHLQYIIVNNNQLIGPLPEIFQNDSIHLLDISENNFTFASLESLFPRVRRFYYAPQSKVPLSQSGNKIWVSVGGTPSNNTYKWYKKGKLIDSTFADSTFTVTESASYNVRVYNTIAKSLTLYSEKVYIDIDSDFIASNIKSEKKTFASVFPNPVKTNTTLSFPASGNYTINIVDMNGKTIQTITGVSNKKQNVVSINLSHYSSGVYNAVITDEKNEKRVLKILKE